jgi:hypothetical protein
MSVDGLNALSRTARSAGGQTQCRWSQRFVPDSSLRWRSNSTLLARRLCVPPRSPHNPGLRAAAAQSPRTAVASTGLIPCFFRRRWRTRRCRQPAYLPVPLTLLATLIAESRRAGGVDSFGSDCLGVGWCCCQGKGRNQTVPARYI